MDFSHLDEDQKKAVFSPSGFVRCMAGAGTGKTTTLEHKVAHLISKGVRPYQIMAVTFTNKAANELKTRVEKTCGDNAKQVRMGTFHSLSVRILRKYFRYTNLTSASFTIIDDDDAQKLFDIAVEESLAFGKCILPEREEYMNNADYEKACKLTEKAFKAEQQRFSKDAKSRVMRWKEAGLCLSDALNDIEGRHDANDALFVSVYEAYQKELEKRNSVDFPDLILKVVEIFNNHPDVAKEISKRLQYVLVDEFQDTNMLQYNWLMHLVQHHGNLFVVGDVDQSLYSFRGSAPQLMQNLESQLALDVTLKTNRRCTQQILDPANRLVDLNKRNAPKVLNSDRSGSKVSLQYAANEFSEANQIITNISNLVNKGVDPSDIAVLSRAAHVLSPIEKALVKRGIPYVLVGGKSITAREEIKDIMAYLKLAVDPYNDLAFQRIANKPLRGLGPSSVDAIVSLAISKDLKFYEACQLMSDDSGTGKIRKSSRESLSELGALLYDLEASSDMNALPAVVIDMVLQDINYKEFLESKKDNIAERLTNIDFLISYASQFEFLSEFVQEFSLASEDEKLPEGVRLSTIHASKGLEFDHVFLPAWEEGVLPSARSVKEIYGDVNDPWIGPPIGGVDEERRIAHVAITRAKMAVYVSYSKSRGKRPAKPSRFIREAALSSFNDYNNQNSDQEIWNNVNETREYSFKGIF